MRRLWGIVLSLGIVVGLAAPAAAQATRFEDLASQAVPVSGPRDLAGLLWSFVAVCDGPADSMARRQCEGLRRARQAQLTGKTFLVVADAGALSIGDWDEKKLAVPVRLSACVACASALAIDGRPLFVVGSGAAATVAGGVVRGPTVHEVARTFKDLDGFTRWQRDVLPRLRSQLVVRVADAGKLWKQGDVAGFNVEVLGFRSYDPCDGSVVAARPESSGGPVDKAACSGEAPVTEAPKPEVPAVPVKPTLPKQLSTAQIQTALRPATEAASLCYESYGVAGQADLHITIDGAGNVIAIEQEGDFVDTPTGTCVEKAVRAVKFPETSKARTTIAYPFILR